MPLPPNSTDTSPPPVEAGPQALEAVTTRGVAWNASETLLRLALRVGVLAALARLLTPEDFGVFAAASIVVEFARPLAALSIDQSLVQRPDLVAADVGTGLAIVTIAGTVACFVLILLAPLARDAFQAGAVSEAVLVLAPVLIATSLADVATALLKRALAFRALSVIGFLCGAVANGATAMMLAWLGWGHWALVGAFAAEIVLRLIISTVVVWRHARPTMARPRFRAAARLLRYGLGQTLSRIFSIVALQGDYLVVGGALGTAALGIYTRSYQLVAIAPGIFASVSGMVLFPVFARLNKDSNALNSGTRAGLRLTALLGMPTAAVLGILAPECVDVLLGQDWSEAILPLQVMSAGVFLRTGITLAGTVAMATARVYALAWRQLTYGAAVIGGGLLMVRFGIAGVALSTVIAMSVFYVLMTDLLRRATSLDWKAILKELRGGLLLAFCAGSVAAAATAGARVMSLAPAATLVVGGVAGLVAATAATLLAGRSVLGPELHGRARKRLARYVK